MKNDRLCDCCNEPLQHNIGDSVEIVGNIEEHINFKPETEYYIKGYKDGYYIVGNSLLSTICSDGEIEVKNKT